MNTFVTIVFNELHNPQILLTRIIRVLVICVVLHENGKHTHTKYIIKR